MSNVIQLPVIAGVEITTDDQGRFNLNALHRASGEGDHKKPSKWLRTDMALALIDELESQSADLSFGSISSVRGGSAPGTFAHELLAIEYAGWISPAFRLKVNQTFLDYRTGKLAPVAPNPDLSKMDILKLAMESEEERLRLEQKVEEDRPKVAFHDKVAVAPDSISIGEAAKILGTGRRRLYAFLRKHGWVTRKNEPYQSRIESGHMDVKLSTWEHPNQGLQNSVTALITGKGLCALQRLYRHEVA